MRSAVYTYKEIIIMVNKKKYTHMEKGLAADRDCIRRHRQHVTLQRKCKNESLKNSYCLSLSQILE